ncbi:hypothetical protein [Lacinutrix salivirga]
MTDTDDSYIHDPIEVVFKMLQEGKQKDKALSITNGITEIVDNPDIEFATKKAISHIFASVYAWNDDYLNARKYHFNFLNDDEFCTKYHETVESYLALVFAKNKVEFINQILVEFPIIKSDFNEIYKAYLGSVVNPNSEEYFDVKLMRKYNLLLHAKRLYVD